ncbi:MAG: ABC transporter ATP-binding protein [Oscillospiraceae bacterium]|jgi:putative spermidine/putrescine transport system ATP-binding protein|nr:ABC transporter ATP-binding protein [Oscillospiraceae bacterium]
MATLELKSLVKRFGDFTAVDGMDLQVAQGEMIALLGGSGCGKTTTLRMIAGFTEPTGGTILVDGEDVGKIPPYKRNIGIFFQNYALFPHMTVFENVAFGLKLQKCSKEETAHRVGEILSLVKLTGLDGRYPRELSGGQQQRVALARALVTRPSILLLDEPLSNLDAKLRVEMQVEIKRIQRELGITTIIVTHDHEEAVSLADRVIVMNQGRIQQIGTPQEIFDHPASPFVADFMGFSTFLHGKAGGAPRGGKRPILCGGRTLWVAQEEAEDLDEGESCLLALRSESMTLVEARWENAFPGRIESMTYKGHTTRLEVSGCFDEPVFPALGEIPGSGVGDEVLVHFPYRKICVYKV